MKIRNITLGLILSLYIGTASAQFGEKLLNSFGVTKADHKPSYQFSASAVQKFSITTKGGKETSMTTKMYFSPDDTVIGNKIASMTDLNGEKESVQLIDFSIIDLEHAKTYTFLNNEGNKMVLAVGLKDDKNIKAIQNDWGKISVVKTNNTKTILGHECDGYRISYDKINQEVIYWISRKTIPELSVLINNMAKITKATTKSRNNTMDFSMHPDLVKLANEGRVALGFNSTSDNGDKSEMEFIELKIKDDFTFDTTGYKSGF